MQSLRIVGLLAENWTWDLMNMKQDCWTLSHDIQPVEYLKEAQMMYMWKSTDMSKNFNWITKH